MNLSSNLLNVDELSQIKLASVKLAMKYMRRVSAELEAVGGGPEDEELIVRGVRFAFRVHQVNNILINSYKFNLPALLFPGLKR